MASMKELLTISRRVLMAATLCTMISGTAFAADASQKVGLVDANRVFLQMPEKKTADQAMQTASNQANADMKKLQSEYNIYMSQRNKAKKSDPVKEKSFQSRELAIRQGIAAREQEEYGPVQQKLRTAIETIAKKDGYGIILDKNASVYGDPSYDITFKVIDQLNIK
jgi:outer membrane protein